MAVLEAKDAADWTYRGEGAANIVLAYTGSSPQFVAMKLPLLEKMYQNPSQMSSFFVLWICQKWEAYRLIKNKVCKVLRIEKVLRNGSIKDDGPSALTGYERLLWNGNLVLAPTKKIAELLYVQHVMSPLLGPDHIDAGNLIPVSREFLESVASKVLCQRPSWRVDAAKPNVLRDSALLISDHSIFPCGALKEENCISVEIKPKCGFLPFSRFIADENAIKSCTSRFRMHQALKLHQGQISEISKYEPLDMFSGSRDGVYKAIKSLFLTPQNNFRVFLNGSLKFWGLGGGTESTTCLTSEAFEDVLKSVILADDDTRTEFFLQLVAEAIFKSGLLDRLLDVQKLDFFDIEGAIHAYYDVVSQPCTVCRELGEDQMSGRYSLLHLFPLDESLKIVRNHLIAATAKDLSVMISFRPRENGDLESPYNVLFRESTNQTFDYKVSFIDLDIKPLKKMEYYYELDNQIVKFYTQMVRLKHQPENGASIEESSYCDKPCAM